MRIVVLTRMRGLLFPPLYYGFSQDLRLKRGIVSSTLHAFIHTAEPWDWGSERSICPCKNETPRLSRLPLSWRATNQQPFRNQNQHIMKLKLFAVTLCALACSALMSCDPEFDQWDSSYLSLNSNMNVSTGYNGTRDIPYTQHSDTLFIKSNAPWKITLPKWMSADTLQGVGDADVKIHFQENTYAKGRTGTITVVAGSNEPYGNVVGKTTKTMNISQRTADGTIWFNITGTSISHIANGEYGGDVTYSISAYGLTSEEVSKRISDVSMTIDLYRYYSYYPEQRVYGVWELSNLPNGTGTHKVSVENKSIGFTNYSYVNCTIKYTLDGVQKTIQNTVY